MGDIPKCGAKVYLTTGRGRVLRDVTCILAPGHDEPLVRPAMQKDVGHDGYDPETGTVTEPGTEHVARVHWSGS